MSINRVEISGNLGRDPEVRTTAGGTSVLGLCVAVNSRVKQGDQWADKVNWVDVAFFGKRAESLGQYLEKGSHVVVAGRLSQRSWKDKETGNTRYRLEVIGEDIDFSGSKKPAGERSDGPAEALEYDVYDEEIPF